ncbi:hypothetical protein EG835_13295, partial [bacterium]|nr:hypothetical protein [bacterium]
MIDLCRSYSEGMQRGKYPYGSAWMLSGGGHVSLALRDTAVPLVRVDFNPNKVSGGPIPLLLAQMFDTRCTRLDVAVDYPGEDIGAYRPVGRAGKRFSVESRAGAVETMMVGARSSARQLVVYDKVADAKAKGEPVPWGWAGA